MSKERLLELQGEMLERSPLVRQLRARVARLEKQIEGYQKILIGGLDELDLEEGNPFRPTRKYTRQPGSRPPGRPRKGISQPSQGISEGSQPKRKYRKASDCAYCNDPSTCLCDWRLRVAADPTILAPYLRDLINPVTAPAFSIPPK